MAGLDKDTPIPQDLTLHNQSRVLEVTFSDGAHFRIPFELMRVYSPSAEVQGHGPGQEVLQTGKRDVDIVEVDAVGNYAIQPAFSDGHDSGIFSWDYLYFWAISKASCGKTTPAACKRPALTATRPWPPKPPRLAVATELSKPRHGLALI